ncbi:hypothetical protein, partial [Schlesneria paludicola]|uniref:hypothetical protein n=1 Tax=Schlesneria paludicola TaxID=360056 RepID=UPI00029AB892
RHNVTSTRAELNYYESFGWRIDETKKKEIAHLQQLPQSVDVHDFVSEDDFVLCIYSMAKPGNEIILAKTSPSATLKATWDIVAARLHPG